MKIAITTPTTWPYVRRGVERFVNELAAYLSDRNHEVTIISTKPGRAETVRTGNYTTIYQRQLWTPALGKVGVWEFHTFFLTLLPHLISNRYDVVHCCTFLDSLAASIARKHTKVPCISWINAVHPPVTYIRSVNTGGRIFGRSLHSADEVIALSAYMQHRLADRFGRSGIQIPVPVDTSQFRLHTQRDQQRPIVLCTAALDDERKGGRVLMRAFNQLKERRNPDARLVLSAGITEAKKSELMSLIDQRWRSDVSFPGPGEVTSLPALYGSASALVLPSRWESFGMVILEALATGTPVVGTRDGAIPELIDRPEIGRLFDAGPETTVEPNNVDGLAEALAETLELNHNPRTPARCRARAEEFSWNRIGPEFESLYSRLTGAHAPAATAAAC